MKVRLISAMVGLVVLFSVFAMFGTVVPNIAVSAIAAICVWELLHAAGCAKNWMLMIISILFAVVIPFLSSEMLASHLSLFCCIYALGLFFLLLRQHQRIKIEQIAMAFFFTMMIPFSLTTLLLTRNHHGNTLGIFYALVVFGSSWISDSGAYFAGRFLGKHKLAPSISPKKTVEGMIGGVVAAMVCVPLVVWIYSLVVRGLGDSIQIHYLWLLLCTPLFSVLSVVGDLSASVVKRQFGVKDYGSIMPGHGGLMDRFDSVLMVAPLVFLLSNYLPFA